MLNGELPADLEQGLLSCLTVKQVTYAKEEDVRQECIFNYKKDIYDLTRLPSVVFYSKSAEGKFVKEDL